jgi:Family of unknown function (DUF6152)
MRHARLNRLTLMGYSALTALLLWASPTVQGHHGWGGYEDRDFEITGTVETPVSTAGPHASLTIKVDGKIWNVVLAPPPRTERAGLKADTIPVGAQVTAYGHRHRDAKTLEIKTERLRWKDRLFNVYPDRT